MGERGWNSKVKRSGFKYGLFKRSGFRYGLFRKKEKGERTFWNGGDSGSNLCATLPNPAAGPTPPVNLSTSAMADVMVQHADMGETKRQRCNAELERMDSSATDASGEHTPRVAGSPSPLDSLFENPHCECLRGFALLILLRPAQP